MRGFRPMARSLKLRAGVASSRWPTASGALVALVATRCLDSHLQAGSRMSRGFPNRRGPPVVAPCALSGRTVTIRLATLQGYFQNRNCRTSRRMENVGDRPTRHRALGGGYPQASISGIDLDLELGRSVGR